MTITITTERLRAMQARLRMTTPAFACYLGVPQTTAEKWLSGARNPSGAAEHLLDVLERIERDCPTLHGDLLALVARSTGK